ncbi:hypothetical protein [uncultured Lacinutrix sp.]|uniref:hypothetical protein n=1 Tax=uncultured Lacinutrix sp. TaxID=574032 RepID=UPI002616F4CC|nr:hypothetical protein [uncultured Lacinutrix sp.]
MTNFFTHKFRKKSPLEIAGMIVFGAIAIIGLIILFGFVIMWLWNWLMPDIFGLTTITYWQAVGLFILLKILIGGCGTSGGKKSSKNSKDMCKKDSKTDFSKWKYYDKFWKEEGDEFYKQYVDRQSNQDKGNTTTSAPE